MTRNAPDDQPTSDLGLFGPASSEQYPPDIPYDDAEPPASALGPETALGPDAGHDTADYYDDIDSDFAPHARRRMGKLTVLLAAVLVAGIGLLGGIQLQKHNGTQTSAAAGFSARAAGFRAGEGGAGFGAGAGGAGAGGTGTGGIGAGGTGTGGTGTTGDTSVPALAVVGQVVSVTGSTIVVKNLGGTSVTVTTSAATTVTKKLGTPDLAAGQTVAVSGSTATDGAVTASAITIQ